MSETFADFLHAHHHIDTATYERIVQLRDQFNTPEYALISSLGILPEDVQSASFAQWQTLPLLTFDELDTLVTTATIQDMFETCPLNLKFIQERDAVPVAWENHCVTLLSTDLLHPEVQAYLDFEGASIKHYLCSPTVLRSAEARLVEVNAYEFTTALDADVERLRELASEAPIVSLVDSLLIRAIRSKASDLHIEPFKNSCRARIRVDGVLTDLELLPGTLLQPIVSRIKILANLDIAEKRRPQDGKIDYKFGNTRVDIRISTLPLKEGESVVMRFLVKQSINYDLDVIGVEPDILAMIKHDLTQTAGVILLTGPTGSGKTTTLYSFLNQLNKKDVKIITLEDPVEYQLDGINQIQINHEIGLDFAKGLRSIVRQDPDIIMLGEIRDGETAKIGIQASLTGHLVFSTVHTNDAPSAYTRLMDLGVDEFLLNAALISIVAQRLVRKLCHCAEVVHSEPPSELSTIAKQFNGGTILRKAPLGCKDCGFTGYSGRVALVEYLRCDDAIEQLPKDASFTLRARDLMAKQHIRNLTQDGLLTVAKGITSLEEVIRVCG